MRGHDSDEEPIETPALMALKFFALLMLVVALGFSVQNFLQPSESGPMRFIFAHPLVYLFGP